VFDRDAIKLAKRNRLFRSTICFIYQRTRVLHCSVKVDSKHLLVFGVSFLRVQQLTN